MVDGDAHFTCPIFRCIEEVGTESKHRSSSHLREQRERERERAERGGGIKTARNCFKRDHCILTRAECKVQKITTPTHIRYLIPEEGDEFLVCVVPGSVPASSVEILPHSPEADGQPLPEDWVRFLQLLQTDGDHTTLETLLLRGGGGGERERRERGTERGREGEREIVRGRKSHLLSASYLASWVLVDSYGNSKGCHCPVLILHGSVTKNLTWE